MRPDPALLDPARYPWSVEVATRYTDMDPNRHVNNVAVMALLEDGHARLFHGLDRSALGERRVVVAHRQTAFLHEVLFPAAVTVHVGIAQIGRTSWRAATLAVQDGRAVAWGDVTLVCQAAEGGLPEPWVAQLGAWALR